MKRDLDLVREILLRMESASYDCLHLKEFQGVHPDAGTVAGHLRLMADSGYVEHYASGPVVASNAVRTWRMTWAGHEFLEQVRDGEIWKQTKAGAAKVGSWSIAMIGELAVGYAKAKAQSLGLPIA